MIRTRVRVLLRLQPSIIFGIAHRRKDSVGELSHTYNFTDCWKHGQQVINFVVDTWQPFTCTFLAVSFHVLCAVCDKLHLLVVSHKKKRGVCHLLMDIPLDCNFVSWKKRFYLLKHICCVKKGHIKPTSVILLTPCGTVSVVNPWVGMDALWKVKK